MFSGATLLPLSKAQLDVGDGSATLFTMQFCNKPSLAFSPPSCGPTNKRANE
jgi:hypothetical protein